MSEQPPVEKEPLSVVRKIIAAIGILVMALSGGCSLLVGIATVMAGDPGGLGYLLVFGGIPFAIGYFFFWLGAKSDR